MKNLKERKVLPEGFNVTVYSGTRHTSMSSLDASPEEIREASGHATVEAFKHYFRWNDEKTAALHQQVRPKSSAPLADTRLIHRDQVPQSKKT